MWKSILLSWVVVVQSAFSQQDDEVPVLVGSINQFSVEWYRATAPVGGNICLSPYAVHGVLSFLQAGAVGKTQQEMYRVLKLQGETLDAVVQHENLIEDLVQRLTRPLPEAIVESESPIFLSLYNRIDLPAGLPYRQDFLRFGREVARYGMAQHGFGKEGEKVGAGINAWVAGETRQRIAEIMPEGSVGADSRILATNGIYFRAPWRHPFDYKLTRNENFSLASGIVKQVAMMRRVAKFGCLIESGYSMLSLPYGQYGELQLVLIVPRHADGLAGIERTLNAGMLEQTRQLPIRSVELVMPRFTVECRRAQLRDGLQKMGMKLAFDVPKGGADFSEIETSRKLHLQEMYQMGYLSVNELGTEVAAAVEAVDKRVVDQQLSRPLVVRVDRPFLYMVQDTLTGACLLMGRVHDPSP